MARFNAKQSSLSKDAVVVTPGLIPCGCIIDSVTLDSKELRLGLKHFSSPAVLDQLSSSASAQADLHVFLDHDHDKQHLHFRGAVRSGRATVFRSNSRASPRTSNAKLIFWCSARARANWRTPGRRPR